MIAPVLLTSNGTTDLPIAAGTVSVGWDIPLASPPKLSRQPTSSALRLYHGIQPLSMKFYQNKTSILTK
jgi:hypothetical protein